MRPFDITQAEYEKDLHALEDLMEEVGAQTTSEVTISRHTVLEMLGEQYALGTAAWENWTGGAWPSRPILIKTQVDSNE